MKADIIKEAEMCSYVLRMACILTPVEVAIVVCKHSDKVGKNANQLTCKL